MSDTVYIKAEWEEKSMPVNDFRSEPRQVLRIATGIVGTVTTEGERAAAEKELGAIPGEAIAELVTQFRDLLSAYDSGNIQMNSPDISDEDGKRCWHEEWLHYARAALSHPALQALEGK